MNPPFFRGLSFFTRRPLIFCSTWSVPALPAPPKHSPTVASAGQPFLHLRQQHRHFSKFASPTMAGDDVFVGAIDQGTTSSRFLIFNKEGEPIADHQEVSRQSTLPRRQHHIAADHAHVNRNSNRSSRTQGKHSPFAPSIN